MVHFLFAILLFHLQGLALDAGYLSFDLPESQWECTKSEVRFVCQPTSNSDKTQAIIILNAKVAGPEDNMKLYLKHLRQPKMLSLKNKAPTPSKVIYADVKMIGPQQWVESLHDSSEVPHFYTLYMATRSGDLSILLQLSASKQQQKKFSSTFKKLIQSLRINSTFVAKITREVQKYQSPNSIAQINGSSSQAPQDITSLIKSPNIFAGLSLTNIMILVGLFIALTGALVFYYRKS